ncbi:hypothetical protein FVEN_g13142 [Fusarium venenatum]|nr:hypothetical protein FVEN_g13142 [Fusarium venenatum]
MRVPSLLYVTFLSPLVAAISIADIPKCAIPCALEAPNSGNGSNQTVQDMCKDEDIQNSVSDCVSRACTLREGIDYHGANHGVRVTYDQKWVWVA